MFVSSDDYTMREYYAMPKIFAFDNLNYHQHKIWRRCYNRKHKVYLMQIQKRFNVKPF